MLKLSRKQLKSFRACPKNRDRASQILNAVEGMCIWEARELLGMCADILDEQTVFFSTPRSNGSVVPPTTIKPAMPRPAQQHVDDAFVDEIAERLVSRFTDACRQSGMLQASSE